MLAGHRPSELPREALIFPKPVRLVRDVLHSRLQPLEAVRQLRNLTFARGPPLEGSQQSPGEDKDPERNADPERHIEREEQDNLEQARTWHLSLHGALRLTTGAA